MIRWQLVWRFLNQYDLPDPCFKFHAKVKTAHKLLWRFLSQSDPSDTRFKFHAKFKTAHKLLWRLRSQSVLLKKKPNLRLVSLCLWRFVSPCWLSAPACKPRRPCHMKPCRWSPSCNQVSMIKMSWLTHVENPSKEQHHNKVKSVHSQIFKRPYPH